MKYAWTSAFYILYTRWNILGPEQPPRVPLRPQRTSSGQNQEERSAHQEIEVRYEGESIIYSRPSFPKEVEEGGRREAGSQAARQGLIPNSL